MTDAPQPSGYPWLDAALEHDAEYVLPTVLRELESLGKKMADHPARPRLFDLGCGNGSTANAITELGWDVTGVDPTKEGIARARSQYPHLNLYEGSSDDDLVTRFGRFPVVTSLEVVEHVFLPHAYASTLFSMVEPGGTAILSTPYHGYWKNLALAVTGKMEAHFTALWDHGHIKFWSVKTLGELLREAGFRDLEFHRVGRIPMFAKSMVVFARKPGPR